MTLFLTRFREYRSQKLAPLGKFFLSIGLTANKMTLLSFLSGIIAVYFLFSNYLLFVIFTLLHLIADSLDGVIARVSRETIFGKYADLITDNSITLLLLLKIGWHTQDYYAYIIAGLFVLVLCIYLASKCTAPILFTRTVSLFLLILPILHIEVLAYLVVGVAAVYSLALQLQFYVRKII